MKRKETRDGFWCHVGRSPVGRPLVALAAGLLMVTLLQARQSAGQQEPSIFTDTVEVNIVNIDVVVTDREGRPVSGLTRDDFEVLEDGRPVKITNFYSVEGGVRASPVPQPEAPPQEAVAVQAPLPVPAAPEDQLRYLIVFIDNVNIRALDRNRVFRDLRAFLHARVGPQDRVMLVSYERSLKVKQTFTGDPRLIENRLFELQDLSTNEGQAKDERRVLINRIEESRGPSQTRTWLRAYAQSVQNDVLQTLRAMRDLVDSLAGLPGRKALLYVSDGLPMTPGEEFYVAVQANFPRQSFLIDSRNFDASRRFKEIVDEANSNRVSFYTLDAAGLRVSSAIDVERDSGGAFANFYNTLDSATVSNLHSSLKYLAGETGGATILDSNDFRPGLNAMADDFDSYYSLGFRAGQGGDGRYHRIEVKLRQRGLKARHRAGYRDKPLHQRMADATRSTLRWGLSGNNKLDLKLSFLPGIFGEEKGEAVVPMIVEIPLSRVVLVPRGGSYAGRLQLYVAVADTQERFSPLQEVPVQIEIPAEELERALHHAYRYEIKLKMRTGGQRVAVGVYDEIGATESFVSESVAVGGV